MTHTTAKNDVTRYSVYNYRTGEKIGEIDLTETQFNEYLAIAQQPQGTLCLGDPSAFRYYKLDEEHQNLGPDTIFYLY